MSPPDLQQPVLISLLGGGFVAAFLHAAMPTHWLPFVLVGRAQRWSLMRVMTVAVTAGLAHIASTALVGSLIVAAGLALSLTGSGVVAALAARKARVRAVVLLAPSAPWGVASSSMEEAVTAFGLHMLGPFWAQGVAPDASLMRHYSLDRMSKPAQDAAVARLRPESGRALWEALNWWLDPFMTTSVGVGPLDAPCLVMAGQRDVVHPPSTVRQTATRLGATYREMPGMSHWLPGEPGWEDVAAATLEWLAEQQAPA